MYEDCSTSEEASVSFVSVTNGNSQPKNTLSEERKAQIALALARSFFHGFQDLTNSANLSKEEFAEYAMKELNMLEKISALGVSEGELRNFFESLHDELIENP